MTTPICAVLTPQELAHRLKFQLHADHIPWDTEHFTGTSRRTYSPRVVTAENLPSATGRIILDPRNAIKCEPVNFDYFIAYLSQFPSYRKLAKYSGISSENILVIGTEQAHDAHGNPFFPLAWYTHEKGDRPPDVLTIKSTSVLKSDATCLLLYLQK